MEIDRQSLLTNVPLIDSQHDQYFNLVERLLEHCETGIISQTELEQEVEKVIAYGIEHLDAEEYLMREADYPDYDEHLAKHDLFRLHTDQLKARLESDVNIVDYAIQLTKWLVQWFCDQVMSDDMKLAQYLHQHQA